MATCDGVKRWLTCLWLGTGVLVGLLGSPLCAGTKEDAARTWDQIRPFFQPPADYAGDWGRFRSPLLFEDGREVKTRAEWPARRREILDTWHALLGPWPPLLEKPRIERLGQERRENFTQHRVHVEVGPGPGPASASRAKVRFAEGYLLVPDGPGPFPAVLVTFYDAQTSVGLGPKGKGLYDYGLQLARRGFVTLSIGTPDSVERPGKDTRELLTLAGQEQDRQPLSFLAYAAANCHSALASLPEVAPDRIGVVGLSYGGKWAMFASCLYDQFACAVWSDPGIVFDETNRNINYWEPWYLGYEPGKVRKPGVPTEDNPRTGLYRRLIEEGRRDLHELHALMAPRPFLVDGGTEDGPVRWQALNHTVRINELLGYRDRIAMTYRATHIPTPDATERVCLFLEYFLKHAEGQKQ